MSPGKVTFPPKRDPEKPGGAAKLATELVAEMVDPGHTSEVEAFPLEWAEEDMLDHMRAHPELHFGSTSQKSRTRHELLKKAAAAETAPAAAPAQADTAAQDEEGPGLSKDARALEERPEVLNRLRAAINELDAAEIERAALAEIDAAAEAAVDSWTWEDEEPDEDASGEQS